MKSTYYFVLPFALFALMETACREKEPESAAITQVQQSDETKPAEPKTAAAKPAKKPAKETAKNAAKQAPPEATDSAKPIATTDANSTDAQSPAQPTKTTPVAKEAPPATPATKVATAVVQEPVVRQAPASATPDAPVAKAVRRKTSVPLSAIIPGPEPGPPITGMDREYSRRFPPTEQGLDALLTYFVQDGVDITEATQLLRPDKEDYAAVFVDEFVERAQRYYEPKWSRGDFALSGFSPRSKFTMNKVTTQELRERTTDVAKTWPQGYDQVIHYLHEDMTLYRVLVESRTYLFITPWDLFVHVNGHWTVFARPYRVLRFTSP